MKVHMDGARLPMPSCRWTARRPTSRGARAWTSLSFGGTKNGLPFGEAVVFFDRRLAEEFGRRRMQAGQLASKMRFLAAPWVGVLQDGAWLRHAAHANAMARRLAMRWRSVPGTRLLAPVEANAVFVDVPLAAIAGLRERGWQFYEFVGDTGIRLMCSWDTPAAPSMHLPTICVRCPGRRHDLECPPRRASWSSTWAAYCSTGTRVSRTASSLPATRPAMERFLAHGLSRRLEPARRMRGAASTTQWRRSCPRTSDKAAADPGVARSFRRDDSRRAATARSRWQRDLKARGVPLYALTNWSHETFASQRGRFAVHGLVRRHRRVGDRKGVIKPDPRIFRILLDRHGLAAEDTVFIDDNPKNAQPQPRSACTACTSARRRSYGTNSRHLDYCEHITMTLRRITLVALLAAPLVAFAHHGWSEYDQTQGAQAHRHHQGVGLRASARPRPAQDARTRRGSWCSRRRRAWTSRGLARADAQARHHGHGRRLREPQQARGDARRAHHGRRQDRRAAMTPTRPARSPRSRHPASPRWHARGAVAVSRRWRSCTSWASRSSCGSIVVLDLRLLGLSRELSVARLSRHALPWTLGAFVLVVLTGLLMFTAHAADFLTNRVFMLKMGLILAGRHQCGHAARRRHAPCRAWDAGPCRPRAVRVAGGIVDRAVDRRHLLRSPARLHLIDRCAEDIPMPLRPTSPSRPSAASRRRPSPRARRLSRRGPAGGAAARGARHPSRPARAQRLPARGDGGGARGHRGGLRVHRASARRRAELHHGRAQGQFPRHRARGHDRDDGAARCTSATRRRCGMPKSRARPTAADRARSAARRWCSGRRSGQHRLGPSQPIRALR